MAPPEAERVSGARRLRPSKDMTHCNGRGGETLGGAEPVDGSGSCESGADVSITAHKPASLSSPVTAWVNGVCKRCGGGMDPLLNGVHAVPSVPAAAVDARAPPRADGEVTAAALSPDQRSDRERQEVIAAAMRAILNELGVDMHGDGIAGTPERYARTLLEFTAGYAQQPAEVLGGAEFREDFGEMVLMRDVDIWSLCEHHLVPFFGRCHIAYLPSGKVVGLSKLARVAEMYARRLQVQERLTRQIADCIDELIRPKGVAVYIEATHLCMSMRGVRKPDAKTITTAMRGEFATNASLRQEFIDMVNR
ncbi:hypothetical protein CDCA_CDCA02G0701 [Cyanidium caldarium]|uniref:GTP cyclohydrolase 1 n=1 Tax=Cyanidium caldarium TaxID=2771 RepID=A0AAV9IRG8_CYACA|nr:hypothetical protein CDCA_CDCA02G0701 [Cyanidium caldarium]